MFYAKLGLLLFKKKEKKDVDWGLFDKQLYEEF